MENKNSMKQACEKATLMVYDTRLELHVKTKDRHLVTTNIIHIYYTTPNCFS